MDKATRKNVALIKNTTKDPTLLMIKTAIANAAINMATTSSATNMMDEKLIESDAVTINKKAKVKARKSYTLAFKRNAAEMAKKVGNRQAARLLGIDEKQLRMWRQQEKKFETVDEQDINRWRLSGGGKKPMNTEAEEILASWIISQRANHHRVTRKIICQQAKKIFGDKEFKASNGWVNNFLRRYDFVMRTKTLDDQQLPSELTQKVTDFVQLCHKLRQRWNLKVDQIGGMDEIAIWLDMPATTTVCEKARITVCLSAMANGRKLKPFIVFKGKSMPNDMKNFKDVELGMSSNELMQADIILQWLHKCWKKSPFERRMLVWDSYCCHTHPDVCKELENLNTVMVCIPRGCTKLVQPADVSWNAMFKARYQEFNDEWLKENERGSNLNAGENPKSPNIIEVVEWIQKSWESLSLEVIKQSFLSCGIITNKDEICTKIKTITNSANCIEENVKSYDDDEEILKDDEDDGDDETIELTDNEEIDFD